MLPSSVAFVAIASHLLCNALVSTPESVHNHMQEPPVVLVHEALCYIQAVEVMLKESPTILASKLC